MVFYVTAQIDLLKRQDNIELVYEAGYTQLSRLIAHSICLAALSEKPKTLPSSCISLLELSVLTFQRDALQNSMRG